MAIQVLMPALSPTMTEGNLVKWVKKEGDKICPGDIIAEIETDKAVMEVEAIDYGTLGRIVVSEGSSGVKVNSLIALILEEGEGVEVLEAAASKTDFHDDNKEVIHPQKKDNVQKPETDIEKKSQEKQERIIASPIAKKIALQNQVDLRKLSGSGPHGRIVKADVLLNLSQQKAKEMSGVSSDAQILQGRLEPLFRQVPTPSIRKVIAKRLLQSKQSIPHFYVSAVCQIDDLLTLRQQINELAAEQGGEKLYKISVNDFVIKAVAKAVEVVPAVNCSWEEDYILHYNNIDISVAVSTDAGLITPIIKNADKKSLTAISQEMKSLASRARANKLKPEEFQGGSVSISNLGMFGVKSFGAIINPPQSCIFAIGAGIEQVIVKKGKMEIATMMEITISCDHRVIDGAVAAEFSNVFKRFIEKPALMLI